MEVHSVWYNHIDSQISSYKGTLSKKDAKKYKLDLLLRVIRRVDEFSATCGQCQLSQQEITELVQGLGNLIQIPDKERRKSYNRAINNMVKHLQKQHQLVSEGYYIGIGLVIGTGIGVALGTTLDNSGIGTSIGIAIGIAIGSYLDKKAKKEGRTI